MTNLRGKDDVMTTMREINLQMRIRIRNHQERHRHPQDEEQEEGEMTLPVHQIIAHQMMVKEMAIDDGENHIGEEVEEDDP